MFVGIYHHPVPVDMAGLMHSVEVKPTWTNEAAAFASSYLAKSALWLIRLR